MKHFCMYLDSFFNSSVIDFFFHWSCHSYMKFLEKLAHPVILWIVYNFDLVRETLSFVSRAAKKASYVLIDLHENFFLSLLCITLLINQKRARLRNVNTPPFMIQHASLHNAHHESRKQHTGLSIGIILTNANRGKAGKWALMRPKAREMTQHEGPPGWLHGGE